MNKKGFTLIELLGSIAILALIALVAFPAILNFLSSSQSNIDEAKKSVIISATKDYVNDNVNDYKRDTSLNKKINTSDLIEQGYITNKDIVDNSNNSWTCVTVNDSMKYEFTYKGDCN